MSEVTIRPGRIADAARLAELAEQLGYPVSAEGMARRLEAVLARADYQVLVAADADGRAVGWLHAAEVVDLETGASVEILGLVVDGASRGGGVGATLVETLATRCRERGVDVLRVRSRVERERAHAFYERRGFRYWKSQVVLERRLEGPTGLA